MHNYRLVVVAGWPQTEHGHSSSPNPTGRAAQSTEPAPVTARKRNVRRWSDVARDRPRCAGTGRQVVYEAGSLVARDALDPAAEGVRQSLNQNGRLRWGSVSHAIARDAATWIRDSGYESVAGPQICCTCASQGTRIPRRMCLLRRRGRGEGSQAPSVPRLPGQVYCDSFCSLMAQVIYPA